MEWAEKCVRHHVTPVMLLDAFDRRPPSPFPPSASELVALALPSDEDLMRSLNKASRVAYTDEYHLLNEQEWYAFHQVGRERLMHGSQDHLMTQWKRLMTMPINPDTIPPRPTSPTTVDRGHRLERHRTEQERQKGRQMIAEAMRRLKSSGA